MNDGDIGNQHDAARAPGHLRHSCRPSSALGSQADLSRDALRKLTQGFEDSGYVALGTLLDGGQLAGVAGETARLRAYASRRDFVMPGYLTPRLMSTIGGRRIRQQSSLLAELYEDTGIRELLETIVGRPIFACNHPEEFMVINYLEGAKQTHGWHLDDPDLALVLVVSAPLPGCGGEVEIAYPACDRSDRSELDLRAFVGDAERRGLIRREHLRAGEAYLLSAARYAHRVAPLSHGQQRAAINMAYSYSRVQTFGGTADTLYGNREQ